MPPHHAGEADIGRIASAAGDDGDGFDAMRGGDGRCGDFGAGGALGNVAGQRRVRSELGKGCRAPIGRRDAAPFKAEGGFRQMEEPGRPFDQELPGANCSGAEDRSIGRSRHAAESPEIPRNRVSLAELDPHLVDRQDQLLGDDHGEDGADVLAVFDLARAGYDCAVSLDGNALFKPLGRPATPVGGRTASQVAALSTARIARP